MKGNREICWKVDKQKSGVVKSSEEQSGAREDDCILRAHQFGLTDYSMDKWTIQERFTFINVQSVITFKTILFLILVLKNYQ